MANNLNATELDFDQIKKNLKNYLKTQSEFTGYNFDGSGLSVLLDVLAYNTHYNALNAHYSLNESFLDSAQIRGNIVTRAKLLGYTPRSILSPRATINIVINAANESGAFDTPSTLPSTITLNRGQKLRTTLADGTNYDYILLGTHSADLVTNGSTTATYTFNNVTIAEGELRTLQYRVDASIENQKFQLSDDDADTSTLRVRLQNNQNSTQFDVYTKFASLTGINSTSQVYFLQENNAGYYEVYFGDGITGKKPSTNNIVTIDYVVTNGDESNGANAFVFNDTITGLSGSSTYTVSVVSNSAGGVEKETTESIRFNAPLTFATQDRAVTAEDYASILKKQFTNIDSISTWGGEDQSPPDYGKVYIAIKPLLSSKLTTDEKDEIKNSILKGKNIVSIIPEIIDPEFTNLELDVFVKYNPNLTDRDVVSLQSVVKDTIADYNFNNLNKFDGVFRHSQLLRAIDNADPSIQNSNVRPRMFQNITPNTTAASNNFEINFAEAIYNSGESTKFVLTSSAFSIGGVSHFFGDIPISGSLKRKVIVYKVVGGTNITVVSDAGEVDLANGKVTLHSFPSDNTTPIKITVVPDSLDIAPKRQEILNIDSNSVTVNAQIDTIATSGASGSINYTTNSRIK